MVVFSIALEGDKDIEDYIKIAKLAEKYCFYSVQIYEHLPFKPSIPICSIIAKNTNKIKVGPVTIPVFLYNPIQILRYYYFLSEISNRRAIIGISRGAYSRYLETEVKRDRETLIQALKTMENKIKENKIQWAKDSEIELYVGSSGPKLISEAVKISIVKGIVVDMLWNPSYARKLRGLIDEHLKRKVSLIARPFTYIADEGLAKQEMKNVVSSYVRELVGDSPMLKEANLSYEEIEDKIDLFLENFAAMGSVEKIQEEISKLVEAGVDHICFGHPLSKEYSHALKLIGEKIIPYFKDI